MKYPRVSIIILNWNGWRDTIECLESVYKINYPSYDVIVVDNNSKDDSIEKIKEYAKGNVKIKSKFFNFDTMNKPIKIIEFSKTDKAFEKKQDENVENYINKLELVLLRNDDNYGFAEGNNIGIKYSLENLHPDYMLFLNNDTVVEEQFLKEMITWTETDEKIAAAGPTIYYYDEPEKISSAGSNMEYKIINIPKKKRNKKIKLKHEYSQAEAVSCVDGTALLVKKEVIEKVGAFDPDYFMYCEEEDWCFRMKKEGFKVLFVPKAKIWHKIATSSGGGFNSFLAYYKTRNKILFVRKNLSKYHMVTFIPSITGFILFHSMEAIYEKKYEVINAMIKGVIWNLKNR
ncbi:Rhamnosyl transferase [Methanosarcina sp. Kolksee]|uniref:glycosyltransferase family 2 protein n=1 Tax=Methanosarcina sp. Kolksee TaxID=1434099 RepID=UPI0006155C2B|nr:glycosyltransferase family 2 protein [Methanosarcina sp. Kolksee]AKB46567.1 Rhamnosyl transferase [Methanosarcina sp. Kolksee]